MAETGGIRSGFAESTTSMANATTTKPNKPQPRQAANGGSSSSGFGTGSRVLVAIVLTLALALATLVPTEKDRQPRPTDASFFPAGLRVRSEFGDKVYSPEAGRYAFGRWREPVRDLHFHVDDDWKLELQNLFTTKYWHYSSIESERYFIGAAIVKLNYANDAFLYVVDKTTKEFEKFEFTGRMPGNLRMSFASSSLDDKTCTTFTSLGGEFISFCYNSRAEEWAITANVTTVGANHGLSRRFVADIQLKREEALTVLFPVGNDTMRPAYVHKGVGHPARGSFQLGDQAVDLSKAKALGGIDWTRSMALRCTRWNWASSSFHAKVTTTREGQAPTTRTSAVGINFSKHVYDIDGESQENAVWIDGNVHVLRGVDFAVPKEAPLAKKWRVQSSPAVQAAGVERVDLEFTPAGGSREDHTHLLVIESDFVQPYGHFTGTVVFTTEDNARVEVHVEKGFGVVEDHFALW